jgi:hypothetical protein
MAVQTHQTTLTPTQVYGLYVTPIVVLPAPPAGYVNNILRASVDLRFVSTGYLTASSVYFGDIDCNSLAVTRNGTLSNVLTAATNASLGVATPISTIRPFYITTNATATTGDSPITVTIAYEQTLIS